MRRAKPIKCRRIEGRGAKETRRRSPKGPNTAYWHPSGPHGRLSRKYSEEKRRKWARLEGWKGQKRWEG